MSKSQAHRLRKSIYAHQMRTSHLYAELADAPPTMQETFLHTFTNPLTRRYVAARIADATMDLALSRLGDLDPHPFEHIHEGCAMNEARAAEVDEETEHTVFKPRLGFVQDRSKYSL